MVKIFLFLVLCNEQIYLAARRNNEKKIAHLHTFPEKDEKMKKGRFWFRRNFLQQQRSQLCFNVHFGIQFIIVDLKFVNVYTLVYSTFSAYD